MTYITCPSCLGAQYFNVGDCEEGVTMSCPECNGYGFIIDVK